jgi:hypothetical protein
MAPCKGDHEQVAVGPGVDVGADPKAAAEQQALALGEVVLGVVVGDPILQLGSMWVSYELRGLTLLSRGVSLIMG